MRKYILLFNIILLGFNCQAHIQVPPIFSDHMVLQQNAMVKVWGWGKPNEVVQIKTGWDKSKEYNIKVLSDSKWELEIETPAAGGPYNMTISGQNTIEINDILIGEVWLGSGQSNMEWSPALQIDHAEEERSKADFPEIRFFTVHTSTAEFPQQQVQGEWVKCTPESMWNFSALMYFFGRELHENLEIPVGLIHSSWGGTPIEVWTPEYDIRGDRLLHEYANKLEPVPWGPTTPGVAYNAMINPLLPFKIKGVLWYQGESNVGYPDRYARAMQTLIGSWRAAWGYEFPFYYVQIAPWNGYGNDNVRGAILRDQQRRVLDITDKTGMVVVSDIGDLEDIHPRNKQDVGKRLAAWVLVKDYGQQGLAYSGPLYRSYDREDGRIIIHFDHAEDGLFSGSKQIGDFSLLHERGEWINVNAQIVGQTIVIAGKETGKAKGIRFAFGNHSTPDLHNKAGLPASCFEVVFK